MTDEEIREMVNAVDERGERAVQRLADRLDVLEREIRTLQREIDQLRWSK